MAVEVRRPAPRPAAPPRPRREREEEVLVWPDLLFPEFVSAVLFLFTFILLSVFINAPLLNEANPDITPNPSKAPWYFLNLQELLLHMDKAWAGVLLPGIFLLFLAVIPYIDRSNEGQGVWFGTRYSVRLTVLTAIFAMAVTWLLVLFDAGKFERLTRFFPTCAEEAVHHWPPCLAGGPEGLGGVRELETRLRFSIGGLDWPQDWRFPLPKLGGISELHFKNLHLWGDMNINVAAVMVEQVIPLLIIFGLAFLWVYVLFRVGWVRTTRDVMIVLFTGAMAAYLALTIVGSFFRGPGQALLPPTDLRVDCGTVPTPPGCP
jgi:hypothetical protein